jgi:hypothetical protein
MPVQDHAACGSAQSAKCFLVQLGPDAHAGAKR